jgi:hypothetical protein
MLGVIGFVLSLFGSADAANFTSWPYMMKMTFVGYNRPETLTNFPVLVVFNSNLANFTYGQFASPKGWDLRFSDSTQTNELKYEIESWNTNGNSCAWVQVPQFSSNCNICAFWGNPGATSAPAVYSTNGAAWSSEFSLVQHMNQASGSNVIDSTANRYVGSVWSTYTWTNGGVVDGCLQMPATGSDGISMNNTINVGTSNWTMSAWFKGLLPNTGDRMLFYALQAASSYDNHEIELLSGSDVVQTYAPHYQNYPTSPNVILTAAVSSNQWQQITAVGMGGFGTAGTTLIYLNGTYGGTCGDHEGPYINSIGCQVPDATHCNAQFAQYLDEVRIEIAGRSSNWIWASYMTMASNATFAVYGSGTGLIQFSSASYSVAENGGPAIITVTRTNGSTGAITVNYATVDGTALAGRDYVMTTGAVSFAAWQTSATFTVPILNDGVAGPSKTLNLSLSNPTSGAQMGSPTNAVLTILNNNGGYRMKLAFTGYNRAETLTNFPALVALGTNVPGFSYSQFVSTNGYDLRFSSSDNSQELNYEVEQWNPNGSSYIWVQVPQFSNSCYIWASWSNTAYSITSAPAIYTTNGAVWPTSSYVGVWHMAQANALDSTANRNNGAAVGSVTNASGLIGGGAGVAGGYVQVADSTSLNFATSAATISGWVRFNVLPSNEQAITRKDNHWEVGTSDNGAKMRCLLNTAGPSGWTGSNDDTFSPALSVGRWYYFAFSYNGAAGQLWNFENGLPIGASPHAIGATINPNSNNPGLGGCSAGNTLTNAIIDEIRVEQVFRSTNWIWASYMTVASNTSFNTYGSVQAGGGSTNTPAAGIPTSAWIQQYFPGTQTNNYASLAASDINSNGMTVWQDYLAGINPTSPNSSFSVAITNATGQIVVSVPSVQTNSNYTGVTRYYEIDQCTNLLGGATWQPAPGYTGILANGGIIACTNATGNYSTFYRARVWLE